jgi:hypothetical protein
MRSADRRRIACPKPVIHDRQQMADSTPSQIDIVRRLTSIPLTFGVEGQQAAWEPPVRVCHGLAGRDPDPTCVPDSGAVMSQALITSCLGTLLRAVTVLLQTTARACPVRSDRSERQFVG